MKRLALGFIVLVSLLVSADASRKNPLLKILKKVFVPPVEAQSRTKAGSVIGSITVNGRTVEVYSNGYRADGQPNLNGRYLCVEFARRVVEAQGGSLPYLGQTTGAAVIYNRASGPDGWSRFARYPNGDASPPKPLDLVVYDNGQAGHVAVVKAVDGATITLIEQNWSPENSEARSGLTGRYLPSRGPYRCIGWVRLTDSTTAANANQLPSTSWANFALPQPTEQWLPSGWTNSNSAGLARFRAMVLRDPTPQKTYEVEDARGALDKFIVVKRQAKLSSPDALATSMFAILAPQIEIDRVGSACAYPLEDGVAAWDQAYAKCARFSILAIKAFSLKPGQKTMLMARLTRPYTMVFYVVNQALGISLRMDNGGGVNPDGMSQEASVSIGSGYEFAIVGECQYGLTNLSSVAVDGYATLYVKVGPWLAISRLPLVAKVGQTLKPAVESELRLVAANVTDPTGKVTKVEMNELYPDGPRTGEFTPTQPGEWVFQAMNTDGTTVSRHYIQVY